MSSPSKRRGTSFETDVVNYARDWGFPDAERLALAGAADRGDVRLCPGVVCECKNTQAIALAQAVDEAAREADNNDRDTIGIAVIKRRQRGTAAAYAVVPFDLMLYLLREAGYGEQD